MGEDAVLFYWQRKVAQSIKFRDANNFGIHGFVKNNDFLMRNFIFSEKNYVN